MFTYSKHDLEILTMEENLEIMESYTSLESLADALHDGRYMSVIGYDDLHDVMILTHVIWHHALAWTYLR